MPRRHRRCSVHGDISSESSQLRLSGGAAPPLLSALAAVLPESSDLVARLVTEFAPTAATLSTPQAYWVGLNGWMTDRLSMPILEGKVTPDEIGAQAWAAQG